MYLNDNLQICLLSVASRYPDHVVNINEAVLGPQCFGSDGWLASDLIEMLQQTNSELLQAPARLVVDSQCSEIYLQYAEQQVTALLVHCRGKIPPCQGNVAVRTKSKALVGVR